jgi:hypothetical protein
VKLLPQAGKCNVFAQSAAHSDKERWQKRDKKTQKPESIKSIQDYSLLH